MVSPKVELLANEPIRPLRRVEYEQLANDGCFEDERVELLFGMVVEKSPTDPAHAESIWTIRTSLERMLGGRAKVLSQSPFAASDDSEPEPDVFVVPSGRYWHAHPTAALLVVEVARTSLGRDRGPKATLYGFAEVEEYWIVNHVDGVVEVYRHREDGRWWQTATVRRGETIAMASFPDVRLAVSEILPPE